MNFYTTRPAWQRFCLLFIGGAATTLTLAPFFAFPLLFITIPALMLAVRHAPTAKKGFMAGWSFGFGYFCAGLYWFAYALLVDAASFGWLVPFAVFGISAILAIYIGLTCLIAYRARHYRISSYCIIFALSWLIMEVLRSVLFSGFPWNLIGYSLMGSDIAMQSASLGGIWLMSLLTILLASCPLWCVNSRFGVRDIFMTGLMVCMLLSLNIYGYTRLSTPQTMVDNVYLRLVQADIPQTLKWEPQARIEAIKTHMTLSLLPSDKPLTHIVWPETAMTQSFDTGDFWAKELAKIAPDKGALLTGVVRFAEHDDEPPELFNSIKAVNAQAEIEAIYDKRKLVPFGEFIPFRRILPLEKITHGAMDFSRGKHANALYVTGAPSLRALICYEAIFPWLSDDVYPAWILNITNDNWFGISTGPYQHFAMTRARAIEQGVPLVRAASSGISAVIDPYGRILTQLGLGKQGIVDSALPSSAQTAPLHTRYGLVFTMVLALFLGVIAYIRRNSVDLA